MDFKIKVTPKNSGPIRDMRERDVEAIVHDIIESIVGGALLSLPWIVEVHVEHDREVYEPDHPLNVNCTTCLVPEFEACRSRSTGLKIKGFHVARSQKAKRRVSS